MENSLSMQHNKYYRTLQLGASSSSPLLPPPHSRERIARDSLEHRSLVIRHQTPATTKKLHRAELSFTRRPSSIYRLEINPRKWIS